MATNQCLNVAGKLQTEGAQAQQWTCNGQDNQLWKLGAAPPTAPSQTTWTYCSAEWSVCNFSGTRRVRFGAPGSWAVRTATDSIECNFNVFGDPNPGYDKTCEVESTTTTTPEQPPTTTVPGPVGQDANLYTLTFSDEFNNGFDSNKWNDYIWYNQAEDQSKPINYTVENGLLKIWPERDSSGNFFNRTITTDNEKFYQQYGYFETRAKFPVGQSVWPAFWLLNHDTDTVVGYCQKEYRPEIDIYEYYPEWIGEQFDSTIWELGLPAQSCEGGPGSSYSVRIASDSAFHTYGVKWEPNRVTYYRDGQQTGTYAVSMTNRMYVLLQLWFTSHSGTNANATGPTNSHEIDYVRVWQFK